MLQGAANRKVVATNMNLASSRSHSVFTCIIERITRHLFARLNLVDLAGSERQKSSSAKGECLKEATNIKSLSTIGFVLPPFLVLSLILLPSST
ncbi:Kinesin-like protein KIN-12E [Camellia lanceoleosa]|uniref:Kinesin-like protein KIN-12E n=1 Tax=Camellia lanceoleosa TaxID=1840588 RepID=A0ACC0GFR8_9ERIC|nr:Kinesin-like protein KIN-12E [Camellia lanceoleosa]